MHATALDLSTVGWGSPRQFTVHRPAQRLCTTAHSTGISCRQPSLPTRVPGAPGPSPFLSMTVRCDFLQLHAVSDIVVVSLAAHPPAAALSLANHALDHGTALSAPCHSSRPAMSRYCQTLLSRSANWHSMHGGPGVCRNVSRHVLPSRAYLAASTRCATSPGREKSSDITALLTWSQQWELQIARLARYNPLLLAVWPAIGAWQRSEVAQ